MQTQIILARNPETGELYDPLKVHAEINGVAEVLNKLAQDPAMPEQFRNALDEQYLFLGNLSADITDAQSGDAKLPISEADIPADTEGTGV